jgi:erythromycin esterase
MAGNFHTLVQQHPGAKVVIWAHNSHISNNKEGFVNGGFMPLGSYLKAAYGEAYYPVGFVFSEGSFQAIETDSDERKGLQEFTVAAAKEGSLNWYLAEATKENYMINFRRQQMPEPVLRLLKSNLFSRSFGSTATRAYINDAYGMEAVLKNYEAIIFINNTTRAIPTPTGRR